MIRKPDNGTICMILCLIPAALLLSENHYVHDAIRVFGFSVSFWVFAFGFADSPDDPNLFPILTLLGFYGVMWSLLCLVATFLEGLIKWDVVMLFQALRYLQGGLVVLFGWTGIIGLCLLFNTKKKEVAV